MTYKTIINLRQVWPLLLNKLIAMWQLEIIVPGRSCQDYPYRKFRVLFSHCSHNGASKDMIARNASGLSLAAGWGVIAQLIGI